MLLLVAISLPVSAQVRVPERSALYRIQLQQVAARQFGLKGDAKVARLAAQVHQESAWNPRAASPFAHGLTQFTPATAAWLPTVCPDVGPVDVWDPGWSLRAQSCYMAWLLRRVRPFVYAGSMSDCTRWAYALRAYNGGEGWLQRERLAAQRGGADANNWRAIEPYRVRAGWAHRENTDYPRRILLVLEPAYIRAGWNGRAVCP
ncbi:MAG: transglycosylase SLT domain-containing protein [Pseudomonadota bacterium]|nr:transglycosylase SLT domain-containing protein [Pseudomonadota bacterium]